MSKVLLALVVAVVLTVGMTGCGQQETTTTAPTTTTTQAPATN